MRVDLSRSTVVVRDRNDMCTVVDRGTRHRAIPVITVGSFSAKTSADVRAVAVLVGKVDLRQGGPVVVVGGGHELDGQVGERVIDHDRPIVVGEWVLVEALQCVGQARVGVPAAVPGEEVVVPCQGQGSVGQ